MPIYNDILNFWFEEAGPKRWWAADDAFDRLVTERFSSVLEQARQGEFFQWRALHNGRLAEIIVLDQFSRNVHRGAPQAFAQDGMALALAQEAVSLKVHHALPKSKCSFLLMPYMHSESRLVHTAAESLFKAFTEEDSFDFELRHKRIIDQFGRYPHRNDVLGRASTPEEVAFLEQPGSSF